MRIYITCQPLRISSTGTIPLAPHIDEFFPTCKYTPVCRHEDQYTDFGYLEGTGTELSNVLRFCTKGFNVERMFEDEFVGAVALYYNPVTDPVDGITPPTLKQLLDQHSISYELDGTDVDVLYHAKKYKVFEFKTICRYKFEDYNDLVANIAKEILLLNEYKSSLTTDQQSRLSDAITTMKNVYSAESCLSALESDVAKISAILPGYYSAKSSVEGLADLSSIKSATYE